MASSASLETLELDVRNWLDLPANALLLLLEHVHLSHRLGSCSRVCKAWADPARQVTNSISLARVTSADRLESIRQWLPAYGSAVTSITIEDGNLQMLLQLPCSQLRELQLQECCVLLSEGQLGVLTAATGLTRLSIQNSHILGEDPFSAIVQLSELQDLSLAQL